MRRRCLGCKSRPFPLRLQESLSEETYVSLKAFFFFSR